jgi:hypothetical protein
MNCAAHPASNSASRSKLQVESVGTVGTATVKFHVEELVDDGSILNAVRVAVLETVPVVLGLRTTSVIVAEPG